MKKRFWKILAVCLAAALLLSGCMGFGLLDLLMGFGISFEDMEYTRPDLEQLQQSLDACVESAQTATDVDALMEQVWEFYEYYYDFYTNDVLASIHYFQDLSDIYWTEEYDFCVQMEAQVDAALDQLFYALADSPLREALEGEDYFGEGFFDGYEGESIWDETFTALMAQEAQLESEYYDLSLQAQDADYYSDVFFTEYGAQMGDLFVELVAVRQQIAAYAGYTDYPSFAYDFYYYRDYTPEQAQEYFQQIQQELVPLYRSLDNDRIWAASYSYCSEADTFSYVQGVAEAMGGTIAEAFAFLSQNGLYDISYGANKYDTSFEVLIYNYYEPFVFVNPTLSQYDKLTFAHEFGHFCSDYQSGGSIAGVDVAEVFSQGMEYLSLCYGTDGDALTLLKMANGLCVYVEQAAYASFEQQVYALEGDALTAENVYALYAQVGADFGFGSWGWDSRDFVLISHFFTNPMYIVSYVVSNDAALQLYQLEQAEAGAGLALLEENLDTEEAYFLAFLEQAELESPFAEGRIQTVRDTLESALNER